MSREHALPKHFLRRCLLLLLAERADYGYDLVLRLESFGFDGSDPGGVYRALRLMERQTLVRSAWRPSGVGPYRRVYELTDAGREELARGVAEIEDCAGLLEAFLERHADLPATGEVTGPMDAQNGGPPVSRPASETTDDRAVCDVRGQAHERVRRPSGKADDPAPARR